jgi:translocation and assembly module TamB
VRVPRRFRRYFLFGMLGGFAVTLLVLLIVTRTPFGIEQARRIALRQIEDRIEGELHVGRVTARTLLGGVTLHDVSIVGADGRPFLAADSARVAYDWRTLLRGRIVFSRAWFYSPVVHIERLPGQDEWNFQRIFADPERAPSPQEAARRLVLLHDVRVTRGTLVLRTPWTPDRPDQPASTERLLLEPVPGGMARVIRFDQIHGRFPEITVSTPEEAGMMIRVASLAGLGQIWREPFDLRDLRGVVTLRDSVLAFDLPRAQFPESRLAALGSIVFGDQRTVTDIRIEGERVALRDLKWLYPPLPDEGSGTLVLRIQSQPVGTLWLATDARIRAPGTDLAGRFGIVTGDTLYFTEVDLRAAPLNLRLLEDILGDRIPLDGLLVGTVEVQGPLSALTGRGNLRLAPAMRGADQAALSWVGTVDVTDGFGARGLRAQVGTFDLDLLAPWVPALKDAGRVSGRLEANGQGGDLVFAGELQLVPRQGDRSAVSGTLRLRPGDQGPLMQAALHAEPIRLEELGRRVPALAHVNGELRGPVEVSGSVQHLFARAQLATPSGRVLFTGRIDGDGAEPVYEAEGRLEQFRLSDFLTELASTTVTGGFQLTGRGLSAETALAAARLDLDSGRIGTVDVTRGMLAALLEGGSVRVDTLYAVSPRGELRGSGSIALAGDQVRSLHVQVDGERLGNLLSLLPVPVAAAAEEAPPLLRRLDGAVTLSGELVGTPRSWTASGEARLADVTLDSLTLRTALANFSVSGIGSDSARASVRLTGEGMSAGAQRLARVGIEIGFAGGGGRYSAFATGEDRLELVLGGDFQRAHEWFDIRLAELGVRSGEGSWSIAQPTAVRVGAGGIAVDELVLNRIGGGVLQVAGRLHWSQAFLPGDPGTTEPLRFQVAFRDLPLAEALRVPLRASPLDGLVTGHIDIAGTTAAPVMRAQVSIAGFRFDELALDQVDIEATYEQRVIGGVFAFQRGTQPVLQGQGTIPFDLAFGPSGERHLDQPIRFVIRADNLPAALPASLLDDLRQVEGVIAGTIEVGGTTKDPVLGGSLALRGGAATLLANNVRYRDVDGTFRLLDDRVVVVDAALRSNGGRSRVAGTVTFTQLGDPRFDLTLAAQDLQASRRRDVELTTTGDIRLTGRYTRPVLTGGVRVDRGALYLDELVRQVQIVELDTPLLFDVVDTSLVSVRKFLRGSNNPFMQNLILNTQLGIGRDFWLRSREMNIELSGDVTLEFDNRQQDLRLTGTLAAVRGIYQLYGRRFEVREGTVDFYGTPGIDPALNISALYRVRLPDAAPLDIRARLTGTLQAPQVSLSTDADIAISQSDLASYLLFGRPTYELAPAESKALASHSLRLGRELLVPTAFGYAAAELETVASGLGIDYVAITSAEIRGDVIGEGANGTTGYLWGSARSFLAGTKVEVGRYVSENLFIGLSQRMAVGTNPGVRLEWRLGPTWTGELFYEDRFARMPGLHLSETLDRKVGGFFLFRDWGY